MQNLSKERSLWTKVCVFALNQFTKRSIPTSNNQHKHGYLLYTMHVYQQAAMKAVYTFQAEHTVTIDMPDKCISKLMILGSSRSEE